MDNCNNKHASVQQKSLQSVFSNKMSRLFSKNITIPSSCIFYETSKSFAFVNLKPVLPGHVLVSPIRVVPHFEDLTLEEVSDLFQTAQKVERAVKSAFDGHGS